MSGAEAAMDQEKRPSSVIGSPGGDPNEAPKRSFGHGIVDAVTVDFGRRRDALPAFAEGRSLAGLSEAEFHHAR
jgi:hypothetical protein